MENREMRQTRSLPSDLRVREEENNSPVIEGYFAVFNSTYEMWQGASESIAPGAFSETLRDDVRALINHDTSLVLGRTTVGTLKLREDDKGLWGHIDINQADTDAMNLYERVKRGDVDQCSFGFDILSEQTDIKEDGSVHWTLEKVKLYEVSVCTFPAYEATNVEARKKDMEQIKHKANEAWKADMKLRLKGGTKSC